MYPLLHDHEDGLLFGLIRYLNAVRERWKIPATFLLIWCLAALVYYALAPRVYESSAVIMLDGYNGRDDRLLTSHNVLEQVSEELAGRDVAELRRIPRESWITHIPSRLTSKSPPGRPDILQLSYRSEYPRSAREILDTLATVFVEHLNRKHEPTLKKLLEQAGKDRRLSHNVKTLIRSMIANANPAHQMDVNVDNREAPRAANPPVRPSSARPDRAAPERFEPENNAAPIRPAGAVEKEDVSHEQQALQSETEPEVPFGDPATVDTVGQSKRISEWLKALYEISSTAIELEEAKQYGTTLITRPALPTAPASPAGLHLLLPLSALLGLGLGLGLVFVIDVFDDRFRSPGELARQLGIPLLGILRSGSPPASPGKSPAGQLSPRNLSSARAGEFRSLRIALDLLDDNARQIAVTGVDAEDGQANVATRLAASCAERGEKTILIDADFHGRSGPLLAGDAGRLGLARVINSEMPIAQAVEENIVRVQSDRFDLLSRGHGSGEPLTLLTHLRFAELLAHCTTCYDRVLVVSPSILDSCDAAVIGRQIGGVLLVMRPEATWRHRAVRCCRNLRALGCRLTGTVACSQKPYSHWSRADGFSFIALERAEPVNPPAGTILRSTPQIASTPAGTHEPADNAANSRAA